LHMQRALDYVLQAIELTERANNLRAEVKVRYVIETALRVSGDVSAAEQHVEAMLSAAERLRDRYWLANSHWANEILARLRGDWQTARDFSERGLEVLPLHPHLLSTRIMLEYELGNFDRGRFYLDQLIEAAQLVAPGPILEYAFPAMVIPFLSRYTQATYEDDFAQKAAAVVLGSQSAPPMFVGIAKAGLALMAVQRRDVSAATERYTDPEAHRAALAAACPVGTSADSDRLLGLLAQTIGHLDKATDHFEDALVFCRKAGFRPELAWTCCDYADTLLQRNGDGDRDKAMSLLDESLAISSELGMKPLMERVQSRREQLRA